MINNYRGSLNLPSVPPSCALCTVAEIKVIFISIKDVTITMMIMMIVFIITMMIIMISFIITIMLIDDQVEQLSVGLATGHNWADCDFKEQPECM